MGAVNVTGDSVTCADVIVREVLATGAVVGSFQSLDPSLLFDPFLPPNLPLPPFPPSPSSLSTLTGAGDSFGCTFLWLFLPPLRCCRPLPYLPSSSPFA